MKKFILILVVLLTGCQFKGNEIICSTKGELYYQTEGERDSTVFAHEVTDLHNKRQICINQPDGSIVIKYPEKDND